MRGALVLTLILSCQQTTYADPISSIVLFGDSFSNEDTDWPTYSSLSIERFAWGGRRLSNVAANFSTEAASVAQPDAYVVMAGINDVFSGGQLSDLQASVNSIRSQVNGAVPLIFSNLPPAAGHASWNASRQSVATGFNAWLNTVSDINVFDLQGALDGDGDQVLDSVWDDGDGLHVTRGAAGGAGHIAGVFDGYVIGVPEPGSLIPLLMVSVVYSHRRRLLKANSLEGRNCLS